MSSSDFIILLLLTGYTWTPVVSVGAVGSGLQLPGGTPEGVIADIQPILAVTAEDSDVGRGTTTTTKKKRRIRKDWWKDRVKVKANVKIEVLKPEALEALKIVYLLYKALGRTLTVTSTADGEHKVGSLHYKRLAFDTRIWEINKASLDRLVYDSRELLGSNWDVLNEGTHLHYEYDVKKIAAKRKKVRKTDRCG